MTMASSLPLPARVAARIATFQTAMEADGGGVDLISCDERQVTLRLRGACQFCPSQSLTIAQTIVPALREVLGDSVEVVFV